MYYIKLSPYAKIFYNHWLINTRSPLYNLSIDQTLSGNLEVKKLSLSLKNYVRDHVLLNSHIEKINNEVYWVKNKKIYEMEYSEIDQSNTELLKYVAHPFNLHLGPLYRFKLLHIAPSSYRIILVFHHILIDGGNSLDEGVFETISNYYNNGNFSPRHTTKQQISLLSKLELNLSSTLKQNRENHKKFWKEQLGEVEDVNLSFLKFNLAKNVKLYRKDNTFIKEIYFKFNKNIKNKFRQIKTKYGISQYVYGKCIFAILLNRYTGQNNFVIGYPVAIREGTDIIYGTQLNSNLMPYHFKKSDELIDLLDRSKLFFSQTLDTNNKYSYFPISDILEENNKSFLNVNFIKTYFRERAFNFNGITNTKIHTDLSVDAIEENSLLFEQNARNTNEYRIRCHKLFINHKALNDFVNAYKRLFLTILDDLMVGNYKKSINEYDILTQKQYQKIVYSFNETRTKYPDTETIPQLFENQVLNFPNKVAVVYKEKKLSYFELNKKANRFAHYLLQHVKSNNFIILFLDRSELMIVTMLAVLKSNNSYVPISPKYPDKRIQHIICDTKSRILITNTKHKSRFEHLKNINVLIVDDCSFQSKLKKRSAKNLNIQKDNSNIMYIIYTSGTTGLPKGVMVTQKNLVNFATYTTKFLQTDDIAMSYIDYSFDAINTEIYPSLINGNTLHIISDELKLDTNALFKYMLVNNINYVAFPAIMATDFSLNYDLVKTKLRTMIVGGDVYKGKFLPFKIINQYGPTEATVCATTHVYKKNDERSNIGMPIQNTTCYVLDKNLSVLPIGAVGELYIGGDGLTLGYLNRLDLTNEKFIKNIFQTPKERDENINSRLYKTGDLVRRHFDGHIEYINRNDFQVKIRGYRVELNDIKNAIEEHPKIKQAIALVEEDGSKEKQNSHKYIVSYYVSEEMIRGEEITDFLKNNLPEYMVPDVFIHLKKLPLTVNGKLNKELLPRPVFKSRNKYAKPVNDQERLICEEFKTVLSVEKVGRYDNFFDLGGNSLKAITLISNLQKNFKVTVSDLFDQKTPEKLAKHVEFSKETLVQKLQNIKNFYENYKITKNKQDNVQLRKKLCIYKKSVFELKTKSFKKIKSISQILLTGATGYLGCNILNQLLIETNYKIFLLVRGKDLEDSISKIKQKYSFYFNMSLDDVIDKRVYIINSDLEKNNLGIPNNQYHTLSKQINSIINSAALVKHYGEYSKFYSSNVTSTLNILKFAETNKQKDVHHISTSSVLNFGFIPNYKKYIYTENDYPNNLKYWHSVYIQTKLLSEQVIIKSRKSNSNYSIYRVGNLAYISDSYRLQENIEDNAFFNWLKCLVELQCIAENMNRIEMSAVDQTAKAIVRLFDKTNLENSVFHVFNPHLLNLSNVLSGNKNLFNTLKMEEFIDYIMDKLNFDRYHNLVIKFLLHQGWLDNRDVKNTTNIKIAQNKTKLILKKLNFEWPIVTDVIFKKYLKTLKEFQIK